MGSDNKMKNINVLILSAGRRVELLQCFQSAARKLNIKSNVVAGDSSDTAPALYFADKIYKLPLIIEPNYISSIISACEQEDISLIVPTIDTDLLLLAKNKKYIEKQTNAKVLISDLKVIEICRDKTNTQVFLEENHFGTPHIYTDEELEKGEIQFPLFIKPRDGSSSINAFKVHNLDELNLYKQL